MAVTVAESMGQYGIHSKTYCPGTLCENSNHCGNNRRYKASNDNEMLGLSKDLLGEFRLRSNPNDVDITTDITVSSQSVDLPAEI